MLADQSPPSSFKIHIGQIGLTQRYVPESFGLRNCSLDFDGFEFECGSTTTRHNQNSILLDTEIGFTVPILSDIGEREIKIGLPVSHILSKATYQGEDCRISTFLNKRIEQFNVNLNLNFCAYMTPGSDNPTVRVETKVEQVAIQTRPFLQQISITKPLRYTLKRLRPRLIISNRETHSSRLTSHPQRYLLYGLSY